MLTGDRQETAINIGFSCRLLIEEMTLIICNEESKEATVNFLSQRIHELDNEPLEEGEEEVGLSLHTPNSCCCVGDFKSELSRFF